MAINLNIELPKASAYQCSRDFTLEQDGQWIIWEGAGRFEGDHCGFEAYCTAEQAAADALFRLAIADGQDWVEALLAVAAARLPTDHLGLEYLE